MSPDKLFTPFGHIPEIGRGRNIDHKVRAFFLEIPERFPVIGLIPDVLADRKPGLHASKRNHTRSIPGFEKNILQFLQVNDLNGNSELARVGRVVLKKTMPLTSLDDAVKSHEAVFAADLSAQLGRPVKISELKKA